ncbi:MAG: 4'-phosphopantetheinyl transferase superfamily protein [Desulfuromonadales bacterium]|nr:4'-phosphopantetheinyl transferase superfamily protein [Desulfuromonadales bacterium]
MAGRTLAGDRPARRGAAPGRLLLDPWRPAPAWQPPAAVDADLWRFRLDLPAVDRRRLCALLNADERARAERLRARRQAERFSIARGRLRQILSRYLPLPPQDLVFVAGHYGKPALAPASGAPVHFNLAHAGDWGLVVVTMAAEVGVDLERIDPHSDYLPMASRYFDETEQETLRAVSAARRRRQFYRLWTRKEARLKQRGTGFAGGSVEEEGDPVIVVRSVPVAPGYPAAVALAGPVSRLRRWSLD